MLKPTPIIIVQGGQWGSEAKGAIAAELCLRRNVRMAVRTGAINAGHTVYYQGKPYKMQTLPTGWVNPKTHLILGPGAFIHPEVLARELQMIQEAMPESDIFKRVLVDYRAGLHLDSHVDTAGRADRHHSMGATGKGCSEAIVAKLRNRGTPEGLLFRDWLERTQDPRFEKLRIGDTVRDLHGAYDRSESILLEGTQGSLLDLHLGPYPYTTHKQTQAGQWMLEAGLGVGMAVETILVCRTFPIRVAGNSGPMPNEIGWPELTREINAKLEAAGREPIVPEWAIRNFEDALKEASIGLFDSFGPDRHWRPELWNDDERRMYRWEASELHRQALESVDHQTLAQLDRFFERTTVTNKLRRIARFDMDSVRWACMVNRPASIALTFANYCIPELWGATAEAWGVFGRPMTMLVDDISRGTGVPVRYASFGPLGDNVVEYYV